MVGIGLGCATAAGAACGVGAGLETGMVGVGAAGGAVVGMTPLCDTGIGGADIPKLSRSIVSSITSGWFETLQALVRVNNARAKILEKLFILPNLNLVKALWLLL